MNGSIKRKLRKRNKNIIDFVGVVCECRVQKLSNVWENIQERMTEGVDTMGKVSCKPGDVSGEKKL